jgi:hypothetical protein
MFLPENKPTGAKRRRLLPGQGRLIVASLLIIAGAFIPWLQTGAGTFYHPLYLWVFVIGVLGFSAGLVPWQTLAMWQAYATGVLSILLIAWYLLELTSLVARVGFSGWTIGAGLLLTVGGAVLAILSGRMIGSAQRVAVAA